MQVSNIIYNQSYQEFFGIVFKTRLLLLPIMTLNLHLLKAG